MKKGYAGSISNAGAQKVNAPLPNKAKQGKSTVNKGTDLRTGK